jgi:hypothetical protein
MVQLVRPIWAARERAEQREAGVGRNRLKVAGFAALAAGTLVVLTWAVVAAVTSPPMPPLGQPGQMMPNAVTPPSKASAALERAPEKAGPLQAVKWESELEQVDASVESMIKAEEFGRAVDLLYRSRRQHEEYEWMQRIDQRSEQVAQRVEKLFSELSQEALTAHKQGQSSRIDQITSRVQRWNMHYFSVELRKALDKASRTTGQSVPASPRRP